MQHMKNTSCELDKPIVVGFKTCARWRHSDIIKKSNNNNSTDSLFVCCVDGCFLCVHNGIHPSLIKCVLLLKRFNLVKGKNGLYIFMTNQKGGWLDFVFLRWKQKENAAAIADKCSSSFVFMTQMLTRTARVCYYTRIENKKEEKKWLFFSSSYVNCVRKNVFPFSRERKLNRATIPWSSHVFNRLGLVVHIQIDTHM